MICVTLQSYERACSPVSGGISDMLTFDPNDFNFVQANPILGAAQPYSAIALRSGAEGVGAVSATATVTIVDVGTDGDIITVTVGSTVIGSFTKTATETTATLLAAALNAEINSGTGTHGFTSSPAGAVLTITAPTRLGATLNGTSPLVDDGGDITSTDTNFSGGTTGSGGKFFIMNFLRDEAEWTWKQSVKGCSVKYEHSFNFQLPENSHTLTTFMSALDAASCCCGLGMIIRLNDNRIFVAGEKYVNDSSIGRFTILNSGSSGTSGKLYDDFNGGNMILTGPYSRSLYEYSGDWADFEALMS